MMKVKSTGYKLCQRKQMRNAEELKVERENIQSKIKRNINENRSTWEFDSLVLKRDNIDELIKEVDSL